MIKFLLLFSFLIVSVAMNSCRQDDVMLSNDDVTNLKIIQNTRSNRLSSQLNNTRRDSTTVTFKQDELVKPPK